MNLYHFLGVYACILYKLTVLEGASEIREEDASGVEVNVVRVDGDGVGDSSA